MKKCILFDLDGTLTNSAKGITNCALYAYEKLGITPPPINDLLTFIGPPLRYSFSKYGVSENDVETAVSYYRERYTTIGKYENEVYNGIYELLQNVKKAGNRLFIATSKPEKQTIDVLTHFNLINYFENISCASLDGSRDSKTAVIKHLISETKNFTNGVMVGDTIFDVEGAKETGLTAVAVSWGFGNTNEILNAGVDFYAETVKDLENYLLNK